MVTNRTKKGEMNAVLGQHGKLLIFLTGAVIKMVGVDVARKCLTLLNLE